MDENQPTVIQRRAREEDEPGWRITKGNAGELTAILAGFGPPGAPITITGRDLAELRQKAANVIMRAML
jgi:hypothetical protein